MYSLLHRCVTVQFTKGVRVKSGFFGYRIRVKGSPSPPVCPRGAFCSLMALLICILPLHVVQVHSLLQHGCPKPFCNFNGEPGDEHNTTQQYNTTQQGS